MKKKLNKHKEILNRRKKNNKKQLSTKSSIRKFERYVERSYDPDKTKVVHKCENCKRKHIACLGNFNMCSESNFIGEESFIEYFYEIECPYCSHMNRKCLE